MDTTVAIQIKSFHLLKPTLTNIPSALAVEGDQGKRPWGSDLDGGRGGSHLICFIKLINAREFRCELRKRKVREATGRQTTSTDQMCGGFAKFSKKTFEIICSNTAPNFEDH
jgi:hypothetical protein